MDTVISYNDHSVMICNRTERTDMPEHMTLIRVGASYPKLIVADGIYVVPDRKMRMRDFHGRQLVHSQVANNDGGAA